MAKTIVLGELKQETATFNPCPTTMLDFRVTDGEQLLERYEKTRTELAGAMFTLRQAGCELVPTLAAAAVSGGPVETSCLDQLIEQLVRRIAEVPSPAGVYLALHGAMAGQDEPDPEGLLLSRVRSAIGATPLVVSLDLHAVLTQRMVDSADVLVPFHTYPHVDQYETGQRAAACLLRLLDNFVRPHVEQISLPMLVRGDELITATGAFGEAIAMCRQIELQQQGLAAGVIIGNAFTDVPGLQSHVLVTTDGSCPAARETARRIAQFMWEKRSIFRAALTSLDEALRIADSSTGLTVFSDAADATASGASGDSNCILRGLIDSGYTGRGLLPIVDQPAVGAAFKAGVGNRLATTLGGTRDPGRFQPLSVDVVVKSLHQHPVVYEDGTEGDVGNSAVLQCGSIDILVTERTAYFVGRKIFEAFQLDPRHYDLVVVKSPNGFRTSYEEIASTIVCVDVPGSTSANLRSLPFERCVRPIFPLDEEVEFRC